MDARLAGVKSGKNAGTMSNIVQNAVENAEIKSFPAIQHHEYAAFPDVPSHPLRSQVVTVTKHDSSWGVVFHLHPSLTPMDSQDLAKYIEQSNGITKPWLLLQLRLKKLEERKSELSPDEYIRELDDLHNALMDMGEWWVGQESDVFNP